MLYKDTSPSKYYILLHEIIILGHAAVLAQSTVCWEATRLYCSLLNDYTIEQTGWHALRCGTGQGCCILTQLLALLGEPDFSEKAGFLWESNQRWTLPGAAISGFYLMLASTNTASTATLHKDVKNLSSCLLTPSLKNES